MYSEGFYKVKATRWGLTETSNGNPQFWMGFEVVGLADRNNLDAAAKPCAAGTGSWSITVSSDGNAEWLISTVQHLGYGGDDLLGLDPDEPGAFNFEGAEFHASCKIEEYKGEKREKWMVYKPPSRAKLPKDRFLALNQRYAAKVKELKERRAGKAAAPAAKADTKDVPF